MESHIRMLNGLSATGTIRMLKPDMLKFLTCARIANMSQAKVHVMIVLDTPIRFALIGKGEFIKDIGKSGDDKDFLESGGRKTVARCNLQGRKPLE